MIAKISATENLGGALGYNFRKVEKEEARILLANGLYQNREGTYTMAEVLADMQALIPEKCRTKKTVFHCSLNPHSDEKLSDEQLIQIAGEYMSALGYGDQPYIVFRHSDIAREHIHIVSLRVDAMGRKINDRFEGRRSKRITDAIEKKYGLIPSTPSKVELLHSPDKVDAVKGNMKEQIEKTVRSVLKHYAFCSIGEMNAILYRYNLSAEEVKTEFRGKKYDGIVYIPTDSSGNRDGLPIHASDIGRGVGYAAVVSKMQKSKETVSAHAAELRKSILKVMRTSPVTEEEMRSRLSEEELRVCIRKNENGRIYGITFIDDKEGIKVLPQTIPVSVRDILPTCLTNISVM